MDVVDWQSPLVSGLLILVLTALGLVIVQLIGRRVLQGVRKMKHLRKARRQQLIRKQILAVCEQKGISLPYPRQEVWVRGLSPSTSGVADGWRYWESLCEKEAP